MREKVTIGVWWKEFGKEKYYKQVRSQSGGGTISITMKRCISYPNLLQLCKDKFFPDGRSANGISAQTRHFYLGNNQGLSLKDNFLLDELYKENPKIKLYLHSKQKESEGSDSNSLPDPGLFSVDSDLEDVGTEWPVTVTDARDVDASNAGGGQACDSGTGEAVHLGEQFFSGGTPTVQLKTTGPPTCTVCFHRPKDAFIECGHTFCGPCLYHMQELEDSDRSRCPQCRAKFENIKTLYF